jgi:hypothetical protein
MKLPNLEVAGQGGRIKGAGESFSSFPTDPVACFQYIQEQRKKPDFKYLKSYFPLPIGEIKQHLDRLGLFRSSFKTDQGMPGTFSVFSFDPDTNNLNEVEFVGEEGLAFPESNEMAPDLLLRVQEAFLQMNLKETHILIADLGRKESEKGRQPFFFVRAGITKDL